MNEYNRLVGFQIHVLAVEPPLCVLAISLVQPNGLIDPFYTLKTCATSLIHPLFKVGP